MINDFLVSNGRKVNKMIKNYYDNIYGDNYFLKSNIPAYNRLIERCLDCLDIEDTDKEFSILSVGVGTGEDLLKVLGRVDNEKVSLYGVDISEVMLNTARKRIPSLEGILSRAEDLPFSDNRFDRVISIQVMGQVGDMKKATEEMIRVLKPGGKFSTTYPLSGSSKELYLESLKDIVNYIKEGNILELKRSLKSAYKLSRINEPLFEIHERNSEKIEECYKIIKDNCEIKNLESVYGSIHLLIAGKKDKNSKNLENRG